MNTYYEDLVVKYITQSATAEDLDALYAWIENPANRITFKAMVATHYALLYSLAPVNVEEELQRFQETVRARKRAAQKVRRLTFYKYAAAAVVIGFLGITFWWMQQPTEQPVPIVQEDTSVHKIEAGSDKATLTLEDGSQIALEKGQEVQVRNARSNGSSLIYKDTKEAIAEVRYNYLTIPRGGQFFIQLQDGTQVWLNSDSQLKYPVSFVPGKTREVTLMYGEAYFDVSPSTEHEGAGFKVYSQQQEISVVGTEFNLKAYRDETDMYTTLVEGKVDVLYDGMEEHLVPSKQSHLDLLTNQFTVQTVDIYNETSWKEGVFSFDDKSLEELMKVLSRWYDIDVNIQSSTNKNKKFMGVLRKQQPIEDILIAIQGFGCFTNYSITGKTVTLE